MTELTNCQHRTPLMNCFRKATVSITATCVRNHLTVSQVCDDHAVHIRAKIRGRAAYCSHCPGNVPVAEVDPKKFLRR